MAGVGYAGLSLFWTPDRLTGEYEFVHLLILAAAFLAAANIEDIGPLVRVFAWGVAASSILAVLQFAHFWSPIEQMISPAGLFFNRAFLAELAAPLFVWAVFSEEWLLAGLMGAPLILCQSRIALGTAAAVILIFRPRWIGWALLAGVVYGVVAYALGTLPINIGKLFSAEQRFQIWTAALSGLSPSGRGIGAFLTNYPEWGYAHSDLMQAFYEFGIGAIPFTLLAATLYGCGARAEQAALAAIGIEACLSFPLHLPASGFLAAVLAGSAARLGAGVRVVGSVGGIGVVADAGWEAEDGGAACRRSDGRRVVLPA